MSGCEATPEIKAILRAMAKNRVAAGHSDALDIIDSIHAEIKDHTPLWKSEIADIVSGYGEVRKRTQSEIQSRMLALKAELRDLSKTTDTLTGKVDPDASKVRARKTALTHEIQDLDRKLAHDDFSEKEKSGIVYDEETGKLKAQRDELKQQLEQFKPAGPAIYPKDPNEAKNAARQTDVKKQIDALTRRLALRDTSTPEKALPPKYTAETKALVAQRDQLAAELDAMTPPGPAIYPKDPSIAQNQSRQSSLKKQIDDLTERLDARDTSTPAKRLPPKYTAETDALRQQRDALRKSLDDITPAGEAVYPKDPYAQRDAAQQTALNSQIEKLEQRIAERDTSKPTKLESKPSPETLALRARRDQLAKELDLMTPAGPAVLPKDPHEQANNVRQAGLRKQMEDLQHQLDTGDYSKPKKRRFNYNEDTFKLEADREALKRQVDREIKRLEFKNQGPVAKFLDTLLAFRRAIILSSVHTLGKLTAAASLRNISTPIEEAIGGVLSRIPGLRRVAEMAPREGGLDLTAEGKALGATFSRDTLRQMKDTALHGYGSMDALYGNEKDSAHKWLDVIGQIHGSLKTPAKRNEFFRSVTKRAAFERDQMIQRGMSPAEADAHMAKDSTMSMIGAKAYADAQRAILMGDNVAVGIYRAMLHMMKNAGAKGSATRLGGAGAARIGEYLFPIVKIPTNFVAEVGSYGGGGAKALIQVIAAKGLKNLTPDQADYIMRNLKKQTIGAALLAIGYFNSDSIGGYYQPGDEKDKDRQEHGSLRIFGHEIPRYLVHNPAMEMLQIGATIRRVAEGKRKGQGSVGAGAFEAVKGLVGEIPFFDQPFRLAQKMTTINSAAEKAGEMARDFVLPPDVQRWAKITDKTVPQSTGESVKELLGIGDHEPSIKRKPQTFTEAIMTGIPGQRQKVPDKAPPRKRHKE